MFGKGTSVSPLKKPPERDPSAAQTAQGSDIKKIAVQWQCTLLRSNDERKNPHAVALALDAPRLLGAACRDQEENQSGQVFVR